MTTFKNILRWALYTCLFAVPFIPLLVANSMFFPYITGKNFTFRILVEIAFLLWGSLAILDKDFRPKKSWLMYAFIIFTAIIAVADFFGVNPFKSIWSNYERMEGLVTIVHLLAYFIILGSALNEKMWRWVVWFSFSVATIVGFIGLGQLAGGTGRVDATLGNSTYLGGYMLVHIFLVLYFLLNRVHKSIKDVEEKLIAVWYVLLGLFYATVMYYTGTRGSLIGFLVGLFVVAIVLAITERKHPVVRKASIGLIALVLVLVGVLASVRGTNFAKSHPLIDRFSAVATFDLKDYAQSAGFARFTLWKIAWQGVKERPLLGWGQDNFTYVFAKYYDPKMYNQEQWFDRTHNVFFDWLIAGGFLGLISYLSIFAIALWYLWKKKEFSVTERAVFTGLIVAYFIHNFFVFDNLTSYILIAIVLSFIHIKSAKEVPALMGEMNEERASAYAILPLIAIPFVLWLVNANGYFANKDALMALQYAQSPQVQSSVVMDKFKSALSYNSFGNKEIREQLLFTAPRYMTRNTPEATRMDWYNLAISEAQKQFKSDNDPRTILLIGGFYAQLGAYDNAIAAFEKGNELFPNKPASLITLSEIYAANKNYAQAESILKRLEVVVPDYGNVYTTLARILIVEGKVGEAKDLITNHATSSYAAGDLELIQKFADLDEWNLASGMLKTYIDSRNGNVEYDVNMSLVVAYLKSGNKVEAVSELQKMLNRFPENATKTESQIEIVKNGGVPQK